MNSWVKHLAWIIGMLLLLVVSFHFEHEASVTAQQTFRIIPMTWINTAISFVFGVCFSLLFINNFKFQMNKPLLVCVFIPCTIIGFYIPFAIVFSLQLPVWVINLNTHGFPTVLSGLSLMVALFNQRKTNP